MAQTLWGRLSIWLLFCAVFKLLLIQYNKYIFHSQGYIWDKFLILGLFVFFPKFKRYILIGASFYWIIQHSFQTYPYSILKKLAYSINQPNLMLICLIVAALVFLSMSVYFKKNNYNVLILILASNFGLVYLSNIANQPAWTAIAGGVSCVMATYLWYFILMLKDKEFSLWQLLALMPFWTWTTLPFPKGWKYLRETEAHQAVDIAKVQLNALKLMLYALLLMLLQILFEAIIFGQKNALNYFVKYNFQPLIIPLETALQFYGTKFQYSIGHNWLAAITKFLHVTLNLTIGSSVIIATIRLCGWRVKRNVYRCFEATSISDFFNRYYYYFKELLAEVFFYPTYFAFLKKYPTARLFFATFMSAGLGNLIFHFYGDLTIIYKLGYLKALKSYDVYALYCAVLSLAIFVSQWSRIHHKFQQPLILVRLRVFVFFVLLNTLVVPVGTTTISKHLSFILGLFGIS